MQLSIIDILDDQLPDYEGKRVMIGLSGGINSAAVLCYLNKFVEYKPKTLHLFHANFIEHSPDTLRFVRDQVEYARRNFAHVVYEQSDNSILQHFEEQKIIYTPKFSGCTRMLKIEPIIDFMHRHKIDIDLVGYVRGEYSRIQRQVERGVKDKEYLISHLSNEDCFSLVEKEIGWYPEIYSLLWNDKRIIPYIYARRDELHPQQFAIIEKYAQRGYGYGGARRVFKHNNCLPCKNMHQWEIFILKLFFPDYHAKAMETAEKLGGYWGRKAEENPEIETTCSVCAI